MVFYRDISSKERKNPDPGDKKSSGYSKDKKSCIPGIKIAKLRKITNPGDLNLETKKTPNPGDFFGVFKFGSRSPESRDFRSSSLLKIPFPNPGNPGLGSGFGIQETSHPEANSDSYHSFIYNNYYLLSLITSEKNLKDLLPL